MKLFLALLSVAAYVPLLAQTATDRDTIVGPEPNQVGFNVSFLAPGLFERGGQDRVVLFEVMYKRELKGQAAFRLGFFSEVENGQVLDRDWLNDSTTFHDNSAVLVSAAGARIGMEWHRLQSERSRFHFGFDILVGSARTTIETARFLRVDGTDSITITSYVSDSTSINAVHLGLSPTIGYSFKLGQRVSLTLASRADFFYAFSNEERFASGVSQGLKRSQGLVVEMLPLIDRVSLNFHF